MNNLLAKPVVKNKFWIVEQADSGVKVATIQAAEDGVVFVGENGREKFPSVKSLGLKYNIKFDKSTPTKSKVKHDVHGFPVTGAMFNPLYDVKKRLPIYTKTEKSKSYHCAGYYYIQYSEGWTVEYCPKLITLNRYKFMGPFENKQKLHEFKAIVNG